MALEDIPGLGAYLAKSRMNDAQPMAELQQASGALQLGNAVQQAQQDGQMRDLLANSGGDPEKALAAALQTGNVGAATKLAPIVKLRRDQKERDDTAQGVRALSGASQVTGANPEDARQQRIQYLEKLRGVYAANPKMVANIDRQITSLQGQKPLIENNYPVATPEGADGPHVQPHISYDNGQTWTPINGSVPTPKFSKQVVQLANPDAELDPDTIKFMAQQYRAGDPSVLQNLGRGMQGATNIVKLRKEITRQVLDEGGTAKDVAAAMAEFQGFKAGQRTLGTREAQIQLAANVTNQFAPLAVDASEKFDRTDIKSLNDVEKAALSRTSSPELRRFNFANNSLINAYARAVSPTGVPNVSDKDHAREILDTGFSKGDYRAAVQQLQLEINAELKAPGAVRQGMRDFATGNTAGQPAAPGPAPSNPAMPNVEAAAKAAWGEFDPSKYDYRMNNGRLQRSAK